MDMKPAFHVIIAGSRSFSNVELMKEKCDSILSNKLDSHDICIISGTAGGADQCGERYAAERGFKILRFPANWSAYGRQSGMIRNAEMLQAADAAIVFWDGISRGSKHMIDITRLKNKPLRVILFK